MVDLLRALLCEASSHHLMPIANSQLTAGVCFRGQDSFYQHLSSHIKWSPAWLTAGCN